eukprot:2761134-Prymnesium_polylepis.2
MRSSYVDVDRAVSRCKAVELYDPVIVTALASAPKSGLNTKTPTTPRGAQAHALCNPYLTEVLYFSTLFQANPLRGRRQLRSLGCALRRRGGGVGGCHRVRLCRRALRLLVRLALRLAPHLLQLLGLAAARAAPAPRPSRLPPVVGRSPRGGAAPKRRRRALRRTRRRPLVPPTAASTHPEPRRHRRRSSRLRSRPLPAPRPTRDATVRPTRAAQTARAQRAQRRLRRTEERAPPAVRRPAARSPRSSSIRCARCGRGRGAPARSCRFGPCSAAVRSGPRLGAAARRCARRRGCAWRGRSW